jgi:hypothetical protein
MKMLLTVLGIVLIVIAGIYFATPAGSLPSFFPGHATGVMHTHVKHGVAAGVAGIVLLAAGWWMGRK